MICIKSEGYYLTKGNYYEIQSENNGWVRVINDIGKVSEYPIEIFQSEEII